MSFTPARTPIAEKIKRSEQYYLVSGDIIFLVENYLYRVHRFFFERESAYFRNRFSQPAPPGAQPRGSSDSAPFSLDDVTAAEFDSFLWIFYNPKYVDYEAEKDVWLAILKLSCEWGFHEVKGLAIRHLEQKEIAPLDKIVLYHRHSVPKPLLVQSYAAIAVRPEAITMNEGRILGMEVALAFCRVREFARGTVSPDGTRSAGRVTLNADALEALIRETFLPPPGEPPTPMHSTPIHGLNVHGSTAPTPIHPTPPSVPAGHGSSFARMDNSSSHMHGLAPPDTQQQSSQTPTNLSHIWSAGPTPSSTVPPTPISMGPSVTFGRPAEPARPAPPPIEPPVQNKVPELVKDPHKGRMGGGGTDSRPGTPAASEMGVLPPDTPKEEAAESADWFGSFASKSKKRGSKK